MAAVDGRGPMAWLKRERAIVGWVIAIALVAFILPLLAPNANVSDFSARPASDGGPPGPSWAHPLGLDAIYRDVGARIVAGARTSVLIGVGAATLSTLLGLLFGVASAFVSQLRAPLWDAVVLRGLDGVLALPYLLVVSAIGVAVGRMSPAGIALVLGASGFVGVARIVRTKAIAVLGSDFIVAARALGAGRIAIAGRHVLPHVVGTAVALGTNMVATMMLAEAALSYLTVGVAPPAASWGRMLHEAEGQLATRPLLVTMPAVAMLCTMLAFQEVGRALERTRARTPGDAARPSRGNAGLTLAIALVLALVGWFVPAPELGGPRPAATSAGSPPERGGELRVASYVSARTLDPALAYDELSVAIGRHVYGRLLTWQDGRIVGDMLESVEWRDGGTVLAARVAPGVRFSDGEPMLASDVKRSLERALHPSTPCPGASYFGALVGVDAFRAGKAEHIDGIEVVDDAHVVFHLGAQAPGFPALLTLGFASPVCRDAGPSASPKDQAIPCGAGPFAVDTFRAEDGVRLVRNAYAIDARAPWLDAIDWRFNVRPTSQRYRFERGELDFLHDLTASDAGLYAADARFADTRAWVGGTKISGIFLNTSMPPFDDRNLRRAVSLAIDPSVLDTVRADVPSTDRLVTPDIPNRGDADAPFRRHDVAAALAAMRDAGYPFDPTTGRGGYPDVIEYLTVPDSFEQAAAEIYQQQLARIGIRIELRMLPFQAFRAEVSRRGGAKMGWASWGADFPDAANFFDPMLLSSSIGDQSENLSFFASPALDDVVARMTQTPDGPNRARLVLEAERIVADEAPWIPTHLARTLEVWQPRLRGYVPSALGPLDFSRAWLAGGATP